MPKRKFDPAALAARTADAYSAEAFGTVEWERTAAMLADRQFTARQAEEILRSALTRWCRDHYAEDYEGKAEYLARYLDKHNRPLNGLRYMRGRVQ
jgi:hypothetical protein